MTSGAAHELVRGLITRLIEDGHRREARAPAGAARPRSADEVRQHGGPLVGFSAGDGAGRAAIKAFLKPRMYRHARVMRVMSDAEQVVRDLFARYPREPDDLPAEWLPPGRRGRRGRTRAADRQFHRRHDRPLRADRAPQAF